MHWCTRLFMSYRIRPFCSNVILMRRVYSSLDPWFCALVGINNTSKSCPAFPNIAMGFSTALYRYFERHRCWHRNFQLSTSGFDCELEFFIIWFNKEYSSQLSGIVEIWFRDSPSFLVCCIGHKLPHIWPCSVWTRGCLFPCKSPPGPCKSLWWPFSMHVPVIFNMFLHHYLQGCMSRSGNVDVLHWNRKCFFLRHVQFDSGYNVVTINEFSCYRPEIIFASSSSRVESSSRLDGVYHSSEFPSRISCSSPRSGRSPD